MFHCVQWPVLFHLLIYLLILPFLGFFVVVTIYIPLLSIFNSSSFQLHTTGGSIFPVESRVWPFFFFFFPH